MDLGNKTKQLFLGIPMGFSLAIVFPISLAWTENDEAVLDTILATMPVVVAIVVSLAALTASVSFLLGIVKPS